MTAKDELRQALLNTCSISDEALTLLNGILDGSGGGGGGVLEVHHTDAWHLDASYNQVKAAVDSGKGVYWVKNDGGIQDSKFLLTRIGEEHYYDNDYYQVYFGEQYFYADEPDTPLIMPD